MRVSSFTNLAAALTVALFASACGDVSRTGRSPAYLVLGNLEGASGADPDQFGGTLHSDVITIVEVSRGDDTFFVPTFFNDVGRATFRVALKDPGPTLTPTPPSSLNAITLTRYRVEYIRSDGRNTQGVDVPYAFDGAMTLTVPASGTIIGIFDIVRHTAKSEAPLLALQNNGGAQMINTLARVTFYGRDQAGNDVSVEGMISISFANFGDPS
jgi:hypothetical protein